MKITRKAIAQTIECLLDSSARQATTYLDDKTVVTATRRHIPNRRDRRTDIVLKLGAPNFRERAFIKSCKRAGEPFPVKKTLLKFFPKAKRVVKRRTKKRNRRR